ncbi:MAG: hypothetical protein M1829_006745 [Trizodia sp. TS-e1964]|nr:MAG: hypothetical protein M1829_006745 [Trizodia sp. TS-e1964]
MSNNRPTPLPHISSNGIDSPLKVTDRSVQNVVLGDILFKTWYPSFYSEELVGTGGKEIERLYVCCWCFKYSKELMPYLEHRVSLILSQDRMKGPAFLWRVSMAIALEGAKTDVWRRTNLQRACALKLQAPPGTCIYERDAYSIYEVDGEEHKASMNLSLFAKLFLDNKSVFYDVSTFLYYLLVCKSVIYTPSSITATSISAASSTAAAATTHGTQSYDYQITGFFSKEKMSWDNNNLACILVFPPWQQCGLGKILMGVSYHLSQREGRMGGPEKPLSDLGRRGYLSFWSITIARCILASHTRKSLTIQDISEQTYILPDDIIMALTEMKVLNNKKRPDGSIVASKARIREWAKVNRVNLEPAVNPDSFLFHDSDDDGGMMSA